jgi:hypothetical protein
MEMQPKSIAKLARKTWLSVVDNQSKGQLFERPAA